MKVTKFKGTFVEVTVDGHIEQVHLKGSVHTFLFTEENKVRITRERKLGSSETKEKVQGGIIEATDSPLETAKRELQEELGLVADVWQEYLVQKSSGVINDSRYYFIAKNLQQVTQKVDGEVLDTCDYAVDELYEKAMKGQFSPSTQAAIARLQYDYHHNNVFGNA